MDKWLVRMIKQKFSKFVDFNITNDWEKFGVLADGVIGREIGKLRQWGSGKRVCEKRTSGKSEFP